MAKSVTSADTIPIGASVVLGGVAGSIGEAVVMPALIVRTRMMVQGADKSMVAYSSFGHAVRTMYREEGIGAFYKGVGLNVLFTPLARGLFIAGIEMSKNTIGEGTALKYFAAGMNAQLLASVAYVPRDIVVERCAIDGQLSKQVGSTASSLAARCSSATWLTTSASSRSSPPSTSRPSRRRRRSVRPSPLLAPPLLAPPLPSPPRSLHARRWRAPRAAGSNVVYNIPRAAINFNDGFGGGNELSPHSCSVWL